MAENIAGAERSNWWAGVRERKHTEAKSRCPRRGGRMLKTYRHPCLRALLLGGAGGREGE